MDLVHQTDARPWISQTINVREFMGQWLLAAGDFPLCLQDGKFDLSECYTRDHPEQEFEEMDKLFGEDTLRCPYEDDIEVGRAFMLPEDVELNTVKSQKLDIDKRVNDPRYKSYQYSCMKFWNYPDSEPFAVKQKLVDKNEKFEKIDLPEVMLTVQICRPEVAIHRYQTLVPGRTPRFQVDQEFCVLGCQYLTELRDKILCVSDMAIPGEWSESPDAIPRVTMKDVYDSGFFYIDGIFYNDMREPIAKDYSQKITDWWKENPLRGVGPFSAARMEVSKFIDLELKIGYPYVYMHQGKCEHLIVFSDLRMLTNSDPQNKLDYPLINKVIPKKRILCMVCHNHTSKWIVRKNAKLPEDPYYLCEDCFKSFHYDAKNEKIMDFEARRFIDRTLL